MRVVVLILLSALVSACRGDCRSLNAGKVPPTPEDPPLVCPLALPQDVYGEERAACAFGAGATSEQTLGLPTQLGRELPIRHVIVVMKENRSFDHLLGRLHEQGQPDTEAVPASFTNPGPNGEPVSPARARSTCMGFDPAHQWDAMHEGIHAGAMDGFVKSAAKTTLTDGHDAMSFYDEAELPFTTWLAKTFALNDRHFASARSGTLPNRLFLISGTNDGARETSVGLTGKASTPTLMQALEQAGLTWAAYSDGELLGGSLGWNVNHPGCYCESEFFERLETGTLPNVVFIDGVPDYEDDHPPADLQRGEAWLRAIYEGVVRSPQWPRTAMIFTYDEGGGFADHVPPPEAACVARPGTIDEQYFELGVRVPFVVISPYAKPRYVSHVAQEHTAVTRFIETLFGLPALTARDANSTALLDLFDFSSCTPPLLNPPEPPASGSGGCR